MIAAQSLAAHFIGGEWRTGRSSDSREVWNPATSEVLATVTMAEGAEVDAAVAAAREAFPGWRRMPPQERIQFLFRFKRLLEQNLDEIARLTTQENGKTLAESKAE